MRILIFGAGAIGQAIGCMLAAKGHRVDLVLRDRFSKTIQKNGLSVTGIFGNYTTSPGSIGLHTSINSVSNTTYDYAIVTTKSYDTATAASQLEKIAEQSFVIVTLQNGCGNFEMLVDTFGKQRTLAGRIITGFEMERLGLIKITVSADAVHIGGFDTDGIPDSAKKIAKAINSAGLPCIATARVEKDLLAKLLYNSALNPLGAILGVHYGALGDDDDSRAIMDTVIDEAFAVIRAMGKSTLWETAEEYKNFFYSQQLPATYNHRPSMLQDLENGKKTEIAVFTGYISINGSRHGVSTPTCDLLTRLVRFKERNVHR